MRKGIHSPVLSFTGALIAGVLLYFAFGLPGGVIFVMVSLCIFMYVMDCTVRVGHRCILFAVFISVFVSLQYLYLVEKAFTDKWQTVLAIVLIALIYIAPACILMVVARKSRSGIALMGFLVSEYIFTNMSIGNQMFQTGILLAEVPATIQWYGYSGVFLGSIWIAASVRLIYMSFLSRNIIPAAISVITVPILFSLCLWYRADNYDSAITAAILPLEDNSHSSFINEILLNSNLSSVDLLLLPEGVVSFNERTFCYSPVITGLKRIANNNGRLCIFLGIFTYDRTEWTNSILAISENGIWQRHKIHRIPFSEYLPYPEILGRSEFFRNSLLYPLKDNKNYSEIFFHEKVAVSPLICYEALSTDYVSGIARNGAEVFLVASSNSYIDSRHIEKVNLKLIRSNAIVVRKPFIRSTEHGLSYFITDKGEIDYIAGYSTELAERQINITPRQTFYVKYGKTVNMIYGLLLFVYCILLLIIRKNSPLRYNV